jgi:Nif-specific regulatory protein
MATATAEGESAVAMPLGMTLEEATRRYVQATLDACDGNKAEAARRLEIGRNTIGRMFSRDSDPGADGDE